MKLHWEDLLTPLRAERPAERPQQIREMNNHQLCEVQQGKVLYSGFCTWDGAILDVWMDIQ